MAEKEGLMTNSLQAISQSYGPPAASKTLHVLSNPARDLTLLTHHKKSPASTMRGTIYGGERGIRTLDTLLTYTPLAGARLQPLGHFSVNLYSGIHLLVISHARSRIAAKLPHFVSQSAIFPTRNSGSYKQLCRPFAAAA